MSANAPEDEFYTVKLKETITRYLKLKGTGNKTNAKKIKLKKKKNYKENLTKKVK